MKRRYAFSEKDNYSLIKMNESFFNGYIVYLKLQNVEKPLIVNTGKETICIKDNDYEWFEVYPTDGKYAITIMYDDKGNLIEWYFDISKKVGLENGIPYEDDLYLDLIITPDGKRMLIDEDDLLEAKEKGIITKDDVNDAYHTLQELDEKYVNNLDELIHLTNTIINTFKINENIDLKCKIINKDKNKKI